MLEESQRRKFPRADIIFGVDYCTNEGAITSSLSHDISLGGISIKTLEIFSPGIILSVNLSLHGLPNAIQAKGKVVRSWEAGSDIFTALSFEDIDGTDHVLIKDYLNCHDHREEI